MRTMRTLFMRTLFLEGEMAQANIRQAKILLVYYSRTGFTRAVAESLSARLHCDVEEIADVRSRMGVLGILRCVGEAMFKAAAAIVPPKKDPAAYDLVVIGTPVWAWSLASPVRTYLESCKSRLPEVAFFCTLGNAGAEQVFAQFRHLTAKRPRAEAAFKDGDVATGRHTARLETFARTLEAAIATGALAAGEGSRPARL